jgi:hypothetical protein
MQVVDLEGFTKKILNPDKDLHFLLRQEVRRYGGHLYAVRKAQDYLEKARRSLGVVEDSEYRRVLEEIPVALAEHMNGLR